MTWKQPIPVHAARAIAEEYGWDQVVIIARKVDDHHGAGGEHCTTYGRSPDHCSVAARIGNFLKFKVMGWVAEQVVEHEGKQ